MRFRREWIATPDRELLRAVAARSGWLLESAEIMRVGLGAVALRVDLPSGISTGDSAQSALSSISLDGDEGPPGSGIVAFATLPFDRTRSGQLVVPEHVVTVLTDGRAWVSSLEGSPTWTTHLDNVSRPIQEPQSLRSLELRPTADEYAHLVARAVEILRRKEIEKVVLARSVIGELPDVIDVAAVTERLRVREPICTLYSLPTADGRRFVGASPELLVRRLANKVSCHPLAGTIALPANVAPDDYQNWLLGSAKNLHEHGVLVDEMIRLLARQFDDISADAHPSIVALRTVAHLGTWIHATSRAVNPPNALEVLRLLHPTAAVGGIPRDTAEALIGELEPHDRGHYAGPLGWVDAHGDGEWWVGIRGILVNANRFEAWAGAGIVSESDPTAEREETRDKLYSVLSSVTIDRL